MANVDYRKYMVAKPLYEAGGRGVKNRQSPAMTYMSNTLVPEADYYLTLAWITGIPDPNPHVFEHVHDYDEIVMFWSGDYKHPHTLGAEIVFYLGGQPIKFNTTTSFFIPKGLRHGPLIWKEYERPHMAMSLVLGCGDEQKIWGKSGIDVPKKDLPVKTEDIDYECYVIRSPMGELGDPNTTGRTYPSMTYMSRIQIPEANYYLECSWLYEMPHPNPHIKEHVHDTEEIVLHVGSDPDDPEDLGGEIELVLGGQPLRFSSNSAIFVPRGVPHGPLTWYACRKPHLEMAIMLGIGTFAEGWGGKLP
ncbi:MAG: cupin domain-containing protein [Firmicutes bacterium]|nr:cupin domain-containing protein [Bacillota bacterium]